MDSSHITSYIHSQLTLELFNLPFSKESEIMHRRNLVVTSRLEGKTQGIMMVYLADLRHA